MADASGELITQSATQLAERIREREVSSREVVEAHIARVEDTHDRLNAVVVRMFDEALATADELDASDAIRGPLHGVPVSIKEQLLVRGTPTTWGLVHRRDHRAEREGSLVTRLRAAGAIPFVKTNVPQLLIAHETDNPVYGRTQNPWNEERAPGGSSGGEGALIAAYGSPLGLGGDLGGSIRVPCHSCGIHGLKPTAWRLPGDDNPIDIVPPSELIVAQLGPMARHVDDLSLAMAVLVGDPPPSPTTPMVPWKGPDDDVSGLRIGVQDDNGLVTPSPAVRRIVREAADALADRGAEIVEWDLQLGPEAFEHFLGLLSAAPFRDALAGAKPHPLIAELLRSASMPRPVRGLVKGLMRLTGNAEVAELLTLVADVPTSVLQKRLWSRFIFRERVAAELRERRLDALIVPPYATAAVVHGSTARGVQLASYSATYNVLGTPAGVVSLSRVGPDEEQGDRSAKSMGNAAAALSEPGSAGLPVGVQVVAPWWREGTVLTVMKALESAFEGRSDYPRLPLEKAVLE